MPVLNIKPKLECEFDLISLGEVMLRLDPGEGRTRTARQFRVWEGGGEYNVARGLRRCFGMKTGVVTAFADNEVGRLLEDLILQGGVDTSMIRWVPFDGVGRTVRNGLNFTERGFGVRGAVGVSDRAGTAASQLKPGDVDWDDIFGIRGSRWFHTGGIFAALSETTAAIAEEAMAAAKRHGTVISYDPNYRPSLWKSVGGPEKAQEVNRKLAEYVDVMFGIEGLDGSLSPLGADHVKGAISRAVQAFPNFKVAATTLRTVKTATVNDWGAICWAGGKFYEAAHRADLEILDRVGGGDGFASGLVYGMMTTGDPGDAVNYGAAHGALVMTTPGDTSMATLEEVEKLMAGGSAGMER